VDSEHNAIFQVFQESHRAHVEKLILTASGGPFRTFSPQEMTHITPEQALKHPNWSMGPKVTIDSSNLMNKGLEMIEAAYLFGFPEDQIDILIHPQSIVHSLVAYRDGSVLAQLGIHDMRVPIAYTLAWPARMETGKNRPTILNAANEIAVQAFLDKKISYLDIVSTCSDVLDQICESTAVSIEDILLIDQQARHVAEKVIHKKMTS
jgi:1-deoxy-D-xylulose-5-phosphate reductoisomerase